MLGDDVIVHPVFVDEGGELRAFRRRRSMVCGGVLSLTERGLRPLR